MEISYADTGVNTSTNTKKVLDSGERRQFETGAVRDICKGKGRCDLLPIDCICKLFFDDMDHIEDSTSRILSTDMYSYVSHILRNLDTFKERRDKGYLQRAILIFCNHKNWNVFDALLEVSIQYEEGAEKYGENNWQKGMPTHCYIDSAIRHLLKDSRGDQDEPHDRAFIWNIISLFWTCCNIPEMIDFNKNEE